MTDPAPPKPSPRRPAKQVDRAAKRHKIFHVARMRGPAGDDRIHLLNLSATGALIHLDIPPAAGAVIAIELGDRFVAGRVMWSTAPRFGVAFDRPLTEGEIAELL